MQVKESFSTQLKRVQVTPIFKKDDPFTEKNYSLLVSCQSHQKYIKASLVNNLLIVLIQFSMISCLPCEPLLAVKQLYCW